MKITVIGGGSTYTPELVEGFARRADVLGLTELVLYDVDSTRLGIVGGLAGRILARTGFSGKLLLSTDLDTAVTGAARTSSQPPGNACFKDANARPEFKSLVFCDSTVATSAPTKSVECESARQTRTP